MEDLSKNNNDKSYFKKLYFYSNFDWLFFHDSIIIASKWFILSSELDQFLFLLLVLFGSQFITS